MRKYVVFLLASFIIFSFISCANNKIKSTEAYTNFLNDYANSTELFYFTKDIDNNGTEELIIHQDTEIEIYTYRDSVKKVGTHDFITGTIQLYHTNDKKYPGIVFVTIGGGKEHFGYITITDGVLNFQQIFDNDFSMISGKKEDVFYTDDKELIALSKKAYQEDYFITYSKH